MMDGWMNILLKQRKENLILFSLILFRLVEGMYGWMDE